MGQEPDAALDHLPPYLLERVRRLNERNVRPGSSVLYWMRTAVRVDENPALDLAIWLANRNQQPLLIYHALAENYPFASDRHHTFILEGARDIQQQCQALGLPYVFHLERPASRGPVLLRLAEQAGVVVTEEMPVAPLVAWTQRVADRAPCVVLAVDTACVVPMQLVGKSFDRAFAYRAATHQLYQVRINQRHPQIRLQNDNRSPIELPFVPVDLSQHEIADLVADCEIDHTIGAVHHTPGGSAAGYQRWDEFKQSSLIRYDRQRNNPLVDGTSRLSAYLHYGMVSPQRIAREAAELGGSGAEKFLDELLIWRELAYSFCFYRDSPDPWELLPSWAQATLVQHAADRREQLYTWETLSRASTNDRLWNAAQQSLLIHGMLHNNVRMTWGKAILQWSETPQRALQMLIDLNHRYALDGRDPTSYGGILWCFGQFDRPFSPEQPVTGLVRQRTTLEHAQRLNVTAYHQTTSQSLHDQRIRVAVVGAGIAGLTCARTLHDHGLQVTVFDKSRGVGGRMATRRIEGLAEFDHGAQYFTARSQLFRRYVQSWCEDQIVAPWPGRLVHLRDGKANSEPIATDRFVAIPGMSALGKHLANGLDVQLNQTITQVRSFDSRSLVSTAEQDWPIDFDILVVALPAEQSLALLEDRAALRDQIQSVCMSPCWSVMLALESSCDVEFDAAFVHDSPLSWISRNSSKPGRTSLPETWILHAAAQWSSCHLEDATSIVEAELLSAFKKVLGRNLPPAVAMHAHRWRFAKADSPLTVGCLWDPKSQIGVCGDWCYGNRVEGAFLSGASLAGRVLGSLQSRSRPFRFGNLSRVTTQQQTFW